jgi:hypothetical protein
MSKILKRALDVSHSVAALQIIAGTPNLRNPMPELVAAELRRFAAHAPADEALHERYTARETLYGAIRTLRRGTNGIRKVAIRKGLSIAGAVLTVQYVRARSGFCLERSEHGRPRWAFDGLPPYDDDLPPDAPGPTVESAITVMVEAARFMRHRLAMVRADDGSWHEVRDVPPPAEAMAYLGIGGEDMSELAVSFAPGECSWKPISQGVPRAVSSGFVRRGQDVAR